MDWKEAAKPPGLTFDKNGRPFWRASKPAVRAGYPVKTVNLAKHVGDEIKLRDLCTRLQLEMTEWLGCGGAKRERHFDGTFGALLDIYQTDEKSSYHKLKHNSRLSYDVYLRMMSAEIGKCRINDTDGIDVEEWFEVWSQPAKPGGKRQLAKGHMAISVLKAAIRHGILRRFQGCKEFRVVLDEVTLTALKSRTAVISAEQIIAARAAAHEAGHPLVALAFAIQFEAIARQWDVIGKWVPLSDKAPSAIIHKDKKWIGPTWANIDANNVFRYTPTKTEDTTGIEVVADFNLCPMVLEELAMLPKDHKRVGPLIVDHRTDRPFRYNDYHEVWRDVFEVAGLPENLWCRDIRASGTTEARSGGAAIDDIKKLMGHTPKSETTGKVYDRATLEAHRRIAAARKSAAAK